MTEKALILFALAIATPAFADGTRQLDAHEHGVGSLNIAMEGATVAMEFHAPGADIVGFEYAAESAADLAKIDAAIELLGAPLTLFVIPDAAACAVTAARAELEGEEEHEEHAKDGHADHADEDHEEESGHTEFHAEYQLTCDNPDALTEITFAYFDVFPNAQEVEVQIISTDGAQAFEVDRGAPVLNLDG